MGFRSRIFVLFLTICLVAAFPLSARAAEDHTHEAGVNWYLEDPNRHWKTCTLCGEKMEVGDHQWSLLSVEDPGSCTTERIEVVACRVCQRIQRNILEAPGHSWDQGRVTEAPTCMKEGRMEYTCTVCREVRTEAIAMTAHQPGRAWAENTSQHWQLCTVCGAKVNAALHQWTGWVTGAGNKQSRRCSVCGITAIQKVTAAPAPDLVAVTPEGEILQKSFVRDGRGYAVWEGGPLSFVSIRPDFRDVNAGDWYADTVAFVYSHGLLQGVSADRYAPGSTMTRAMLAAAIHRIEGSPDCDGSHFSDVAPGAWYYNAVNWAASQGILAGTGGGRFSPDAAVTREQMVTILYRYAGYLGLDRTGRAGLTGFTDSGDISAYAVTAMEWSVDAGLISGMGDGRAAPKATATRAQVAAVLKAMAVRITEELGRPVE